jgi:predicted transport protein
VRAEEASVALFRIEEDGLHKIGARDFASEAELHKLFDANLEALLGVRFVEAEYPIPGGRIETLGLDEHNVPVVVEYKQGQDPGAIVQGLFYLDWVMSNRRAFEAIAREKLGATIKVNWSARARLIVVAKDFNARELAAVSQIAATVELKKYSYYADLLQVDDFIPLKRRRSAADQQGPDIEKEYPIEDLLRKAEPAVGELFLGLRERILALAGVWEKVGAGYCDYRTTSTFASTNVQKKRLVVYIKMGERVAEDARGITERKDFTYGRLNTRFCLYPGDDLDYATFLIKQAYEYVT